MVADAPPDADVVNDPENPLGSRVAKHLYATAAVVRIFSDGHPDKAIQFSGLPGYQDLAGNGLGPYLK